MKPSTKKMYMTKLKSNIKIISYHTVKNVFQYLMDDVDEWSTEYGVYVWKIDDLNISPHYWNKNCLYVSADRTLNSYTWRFGLECFRLTTNQTYSLVAGMRIEGHNTKKYQYQYSAGKFLYYTKTLVQLIKQVVVRLFLCVLLCIMSIRELTWINTQMHLMIMCVLLLME